MADAKDGNLTPLERQAQDAIDFAGDVGKDAAGNPLAPKADPREAVFAKQEEVAERIVSHPDDPSEAHSGCLAVLGRERFKMLIAFLAAVMVAIIGVVLATRDDKACAATAQGACNNTKANPAVGGQGAAPAADAGAGSPYAGHYVLVEGLNDPTGIDVHNFGGRGPGSLGGSSASVDIDGNGTVTAGSIHTSIDQNGCHYTADGNNASGNVGTNGMGRIIFLPVHTESGECQEQSATYSMPYELGIQGDDLYLCKAAMATSSTCSDGATPSKFTKQT